MKEITSVNNSLIKEIINLKDKKNRLLQEKFIVEGYHLVEEAFLDGSLEMILTTDSTLKYNVETYYVTDVIIKKISSTLDPQGIIGIVKFKKWPVKDYQKYIILDDISDPGNLGTIIRSSAALGIDALIISNDTVDIYNDKVLRATQGAIFKLPIYRMNIEEAIKTLKKRGILVIGTSLDARDDLTKMGYLEKFGIMFGNESRGLNSKYQEMADQLVKITMKNQVESLNVAMSMGIIAYYILNK